MRPASRARQVFEGRLTYDDQQVLENGETHTRVHLVLAFSGERTQQTEGEAVRIRDSFSAIRLLEADPPQTMPDSFAVEFLLAKESGFVFRSKPENRLSFLTDALERLYPAAHFVFSGKIREDAEEKVEMPLALALGSQWLRTVRPFLFRVKQWQKTRIQNEISIGGEYLSTELGTLQVDGFGASCVGKSEISTDFQMDSGVWTRIDAMEILGWAAVGFDDASLAPVQVGNRVVMRLQMQLTDIQQQKK